MYKKCAAENATAGRFFGWEGSRALCVFSINRTIGIVYYCVFIINMLHWLNNGQVVKKGMCLGGN